MSDVQKSGKLKIENGKFVAEGALGFVIDGDNDGEAVVDFSSNNILKIDVIEGLSELVKTSDNELLKKAAPFAEMILKNVAGSISTP